MTRVYPSVGSAAGAAMWWNKKGCEVYFVGNSHRMVPDAKRRITKPRKADIALSVGVWADIDGVGADPSVVSELRSFLDYEPAYIVASGGGLQAFWRLAEYTDDTDTAEQANLWLITELAGLLGWDTGNGGVDKSCWTRDHLWRLPGTMNHKRGRRARLLFVSDERVPLDDLGRVQPEVRVSGGEFSVGDHSWVTQAYLREVLPPYLFGYFWDDGADRSVHVHRFLRKFFQAVGTDPQFQTVALAILMIDTDDPRFVSHHSHHERKGDHFIPRRDPEAEAKRQIRKWIEKHGTE